MIRTVTLVVISLLSACTEPPKHEIVFMLHDTCKIVINDLQYGQANNTERPCNREISGTTINAVTVNFLSETCNAYRYSFKAAREGSEGIFVFMPEQNEPNPNCTFIPEYANPDAEWILSTQTES